MTYRKAILLHAVAIPLGASLIIILLILFGVGKFKNSQSTKIKDYQAYQKLTKQLTQSESRAASLAASLEAWRTALNKDFTPAFREKLLTLCEKIDDSRSLQQTQNPSVSGNSQIAPTGGQRAVQIRFALHGGFEPMQETLIELETLFPQMQLENAEIKPDPKSEGLQFDFTYTAWEKSTS